MERVASAIAAATNTYALYPPNHPRVSDSTKRVMSAIREAVEQSGEEVLSFVLVGDDLLLGNQLVRRSALPVHEFIGVLKLRGVESLRIAAGAAEEEIGGLVGSLSTGEGVRSSANVSIGTIQIVMDDKPKEGEAKLDFEHEIEIVREAWARFKVDRRLPIDQLEELVWSMIDSFGGTARAMLPLGAMREHDEHTFVNAINVSMLVLAQARSLGIWGPMLHAFGMAALLHDIGKLDVPVEILGKSGKLNDEEWAVMKTHPVNGAAYLIENGGPPLSVVVAFEHHLRHDGHANYPRLRKPRTPHLASRMTAIADAYDGMCAARPYQVTLSRAAALEVLKQRADTFYDPMLVGNFVRMIGEVREV